jgi:hypothetical protein
VTKTTHGSPAGIIAATEAAFPMPEGEIRRLQARRWILHWVKKGGVGAEIGVFRGHFSDLICQVAQPRKLYLIDPWTKAGPTFGWGAAYTNFGTLSTSAARDQAAAFVRQYPSVECVLIEDTYPTCADAICEPLDFAYLDASHSYERTLQELRSLDRQITQDGTIIGDDWAPEPASQHHGVFRAVQDFVSAADWQIVAAGPGAQWAVRRTHRG